MKTVFLNQFNGGIVNDPRLPLEHVCRMCTRFDIFTNPRKLTPYLGSENGDVNGVGDDTGATSRKQNFLIAQWFPASSGAYRLFGLGVVSGTARAEVLMKDLTTGGTSDLGDGNWAASINNQSASGTTSFNLFVYYKKTGRIYGARAGTHIWAYDPTTVSAWDDTQLALTYTNIAQGLVHSKDDILYVPYDNKIARKNGASAWESVVLTLPTHLYITSIAEYGNYLAIAAAPLSGVGNSVVYLWDRDSTLATLSESIDWGEGILKVIHELEGSLLGITVAQSGRNKSRVVFKSYAPGMGAVKFNELISGSNFVTLLPHKQKLDDRLYFMMSINLNGEDREGVWSIGRSTTNVPFSIAHEATPNNDTDLGNGSILAFFKVGDYLFQSFINHLGVYYLSKTTDAGTYAATSIYETGINPKIEERDRPLLKQLISVGATYEPLPATGQVVVKYRVDGGDWVTIFTETTNDAVYTEPHSAAANGEQFTSGKEFEFRLESTGGAEITGLSYKYKELDSNI